MIVALIAIWIFSFFGGDDAQLRSALNALEERVHAVVTDDGQRARIDAIVQDTITKLEAEKPKVQQRAEACLALLRKHDAPLRDINIALDELAGDRLVMQALVLDLRFALREQLSREQWAAVFAR